MNNRLRNVFVHSSAVLLVITLSACQNFGPHSRAPAEAAPAPVLHTPLAMHEFLFDAEHDDVVGEPQVTTASAADTFSDIARRFNVGYEEMVRANPGVDPWLPGEGTKVVVPTQFVLPDAPRSGLVINLAAMRVYYFPKRAEGELQKVITHPIGIGKVGWSTPVGVTKVMSKVKNPTWHPPSSVRREHAAAGDPLPGRVPPGPDNPLGVHMMRLGWPSYLIHGTNKPYGVGMRSSHGCIRFYPEDIGRLFDRISVGTPVQVVNQPLVFGWHADALYVQAFPVMEDDKRQHPTATQLVERLSTHAHEKMVKYSAVTDAALIERLVNDARGIATPVNKSDLTFEGYLASARQVENTLPHGATWDGSEELLVSAEQFDAIRSGKPWPPQPKAKAAPAARRKPAAASATQPKATAKASVPQSATTTAREAQIGVVE